MQYSTSVWMQESKTHAIKHGFVLFKILCTMDLKPRGPPKWSNCAQIMHKKLSFPDTKVWIVQNMHNSFSCTAVSMKHVESGSFCIIVSPFGHHISLAPKKQKNTLNVKFSVQFPYCAEPWAEWLLLHYSVAFSSLYIPGRKKTKHNLSMTF